MASILWTLQQGLHSCPAHAWAAANADLAGQPAAGSCASRAAATSRVTGCGTHFSGRGQWGPSRHAQAITTVRACVRASGGAGRTPGRLGGQGAAPGLELASLAGQLRTWGMKPCQRGSSSWRWGLQGFLSRGQCRSLAGCLSGAGAAAVVFPAAPLYDLFPWRSAQCPWCCCLPRQAGRQAARAVEPGMCAPCAAGVWSYWSTDGLGLFEYMLLVEELGVEPIWVINNGIAHQESECCSVAWPLLLPLPC
jgi:hypothetical protein